MDDQATVIAGLREWARGGYATEAAVELLVRSFGGRFASCGEPWIRHRPRGYWLDVDVLADFTGSLSYGERRVLAVAEALASNGPLTELTDVLAGVDRRHLQLILAALAHAGGSHEHSGIRRADDAIRFERLGPLVEWPRPDSGGSEGR